MSLATKYRPQSLSELVGQNHIAQTLSNAVRREKLAQAYLFCGPRGVGKTSTARILAKMLNCDKGPTSNPCNSCGSCREITNGSAVDVIEIDGASHTGVDDIREIINNCQYLPARLRQKVYIIDEIHMLSNSAFNALLKTLEEPPKHIVFVFATTDPQKIPATVLSRCQRFDFRKIPIPVIATNLRAILEKEKISIEPDALRSIAEISEGSLRDAQTLCEQAVAFSGKTEVSAVEINQMLGLIDRRLLLDLTSALCEKRTAEVLTILQQIDNGGYDLKRAITRLVQNFRNCLILKVCPQEPGLLEDDVSDIEALSKILEPLSFEEIDRTLTLLLENLRQLAQTETPYILCQSYLVKICELPELPKIDQLIQKLSTISSGRPLEIDRPSTSSSVSPSPTVHAPASPKDWGGFIEFVKSRKPGFAALLYHIGRQKIEGSIFYIEIDKEGFYYQTLADPSNLQQLEQFIAQFFGRPLKVKFSAAPKDAASVQGNPAREEQSMLADKKRELLENPVVKESQRLFGGKIEEIKLYGVKTNFAPPPPPEESDESDGEDDHV